MKMLNMKMQNLKMLDTKIDGMKYYLLARKLSGARLQFATL